MIKRISGSKKAEAKREKQPAQAKKKTEKTKQTRKSEGNKASAQSLPSDKMNQTADALSAKCDTFKPNDPNPDPLSPLCAGKIIR